MKLEKNSRAVDYIGELIERYNRDSTIFSKALQIYLVLISYKVVGLIIFKS